jgi:hypothetical protein
MAVLNQPKTNRLITDVVDIVTVKYTKGMPVVVSKENSESPVLSLVIRQRA